MPVAQQETHRSPIVLPIDCGSFEGDQWSMVRLVWPCLVPLEIYSKKHILKTHTHIMCGSELLMFVP